MRLPSGIQVLTPSPEPPTRFSSLARARAHTQLGGEGFEHMFMMRSDGSILSSGFFTLLNLVLGLKRQKKEASVSHTRDIVLVGAVGAQGWSPITTMGMVSDFYLFLDIN